MKATGLIIGAGIVGSAVAYELSRRGVKDLHVVDLDLEGSLSSTERNAGGVRHLWQQRINSELSKVSIDLFDKVGEEIGFQRTGYLWMFNKEQAEEGNTLLAQAEERKLSYEYKGVDQLREEYPWIDKTDDLAFAVYGVKDGLINSNSLKTYFRSNASRAGVKFHDLTLASEITENGPGCQATLMRLPSQIEAQRFLQDPSQTPEGQSETWRFDFVVFCTGGWTPWLFERVQIPALVKPIRRQIVLFKAEDFDLGNYGMIIDPSRVYFHPEAGNIVAGMVLHDEPPGYRFDVDNDFFESHIWPALYERSTKLEKLKYMTGWGGLYSYSPDQTGILGKIPGYSSLYEAHSFTGRGVMQSYGAAVCLAELVLDGRFTTLDANPLSRARFRADKSKWLNEGLII